LEVSWRVERRDEERKLNAQVVHSPRDGAESGSEVLCLLLGQSSERRDMASVGIIILISSSSRLREDEKRRTHWNGMTIVSKGQLAQNGTTATKCLPTSTTRESSSPFLCLASSEAA